MTSTEIRNSFLNFFEERGHRIVSSSSVIPYDDPTLLFTNAGMNQFKDVFLGTGKREYSRAADSQKCIRVSGKHNDLEEVGRDTYHHTFFEMLGNWSFGDYYKKEAIEWAWELLTKVWQLDKKRLYATVYESDDEAEQLWKKMTDINPAHVLRFGKKDNFWEMGETGPCGPCSEIHIDLTDDLSGGKLVNAGDARVMEIWNLVFIQYNRDDKGTLTPLPSKHVDTGMGFERICAVLQGKKSNYETDVFMPIIRKISELVGKPYQSKVDDPLDIAMRVVADHARMLSFSIADGGIPSNEGRGYVMRRILRRGARFGRTLGLHEPFIYKVVEAVVKSMGKQFPEIREKQNHIERVIKGEENSFNQTLDRGLEIFESVIEKIGHSKTFPGEDAFKLYDTFGFPLDLTEMMAGEHGLKVDSGRFVELMGQQKQRSKKKHERSSWFDKIFSSLKNKHQASDELLLPKLYLQISEWEKAEEALRNVVKMNPRDARAWYLLGRTLLQEQKYDDMLDAFNKSLSISKEFEKSISDDRKYAWGQTLNHGVNLYNKSVTASPDSATMLLSKAIEAYTVAITISPDSAINYQNMAVAQRAQGNHDEAIKYLKLALDRKKDPQTSTFLINAYLQKAGELKKSEKDATEYYNAAIDELTKARAADSENQELLGTLINVYIDASRPKEAVPFIREAVARDPKNKIFQNDLGLLLMEADSLEQAIEHFEASLTVDNMFEDALRNGAVAYLKLGDRMKDAARASVDSKESKEVDRSYIEKFKQAINLLERLKEKKPNDPNVWDALATAYGNAGMIEKAKEAIKESDKRRPGANSHTKMAEKPSVLTIDEWIGDNDFRDNGVTQFVGYENLEVRSSIKLVRLRVGYYDIVLDRTPFYVESGGQVDDSGILIFVTNEVPVVDVAREGKQIVHTIEDSDILVVNPGLEVVAKVGVSRRQNIMRNHTATHLVHEALRKVLGEHLHQQGSLVAPDHLRFDFNHFEKITPDQIRAIEDIVNGKISEGVNVEAKEMPIEEAKKISGIKMFFGEKYSDIVRVIKLEDGFSAELCGGTHVKNTKDIQLFKIISESSIASGIRRIEAVTGEGLNQHIQKLIEKAGEMDAQIEKLIIEKEELEKQLGQFAKVEQATRPSLGKISLLESITPKVVDEVERAIQERASAIEMVSKSTSDLKKELSKYRVKKVSSGIESLVANAQIVDGMKIVSGKVDVQSVDELQSLGDTLRSKLGSGVGVLGAVMNEKVSLVCVVTDDLIKNKKLQAGKIVGEIAKLVGGGGGGRPHLATAGGKDAPKLDEALKQVGMIVKNLLK